MKQIKIRIYPDGIVLAETNGIKGKKCTDYINLIQEITDTKVSEQEYTLEYYEVENEEIIVQEDKITRVV
ncbi:DUF2997 domain-containing protein [Clostridium estertheticum]|uniref:DUF2997 domain-containing protein n=1 Tax=Clostridium estertheticum TaxID=238834 RepID=UPI00217CEFE9|nr:DUF2997 domain-containing protein [Clostridium estertheticum]